MAGSASNPAGDLSTEIESFIQSHRVARFATVSQAGAPSVVPICYAYERGVFYSALDQKPKSVPVTELKRVRNLRSNPNVALVIDDYSDDWSKLAHLTVSGTAELLSAADPNSREEHAKAVELLRRKYPQYGSMAIDSNPVIKITVINARLWRSGDASETERST